MELELETAPDKQGSFAQLQHMSTNTFQDVTRFLV